MIWQQCKKLYQEMGITIPHSALRTPHFEVTISVPAGEELAKKTLNSRLGIVGGISILGTTGIVKPMSTDAYTASITAGMDVAKAMGRTLVVLSSGRTSEKAHMKKYGFADEAYVMMGDYLEYSLQDAKKHGFEAIHLCAQWAKMIKTAMSTPQTHVRHGAIGGDDAAVFLRSRGIRHSRTSVQYGPGDIRSHHARCGEPRWRPVRGMQGSKAVLRDGSRRACRSSSASYPMRGRSLPTANKLHVVGIGYRPLAGKAREKVLAAGGPARLEQALRGVPAV